MKTNNLSQKSEWPVRPGHHANTNQKHRLNFIATWSAENNFWPSLPLCSASNVEPVLWMRRHKVSGSEIAGAVATCLLRDLQCNGWRVKGFPQISINRTGCDATEFVITLNFYSAGVVFTVPALDAIRAGRRFKNGLPQADAFFDLLQAAIAKLEGMPCK